MNHLIRDYRILIPANKGNLRANRFSLSLSLLVGEFRGELDDWRLPVSFIISRSDELFYLDLPSQTFTPSTPKHFHAISRDIPFSFLPI